MARSLLLSLLFAIAIVCIPNTISARDPSKAEHIETPDVTQLEREIRALEDALDQHTDDEPYIVIDTIHNSLQLRRRNRILRKAICATGSGKVLLSHKKGDWRFATPKGKFRVLRKVRDPVWAKPEWAFVERGQAVPVLPWDFKRLDAVALGEFALELGDGYEIHGTLYPHLLGRHITHGCIRLNDEDLEKTFNTVKTGSPIYIY